MPRSCRRGGWTARSFFAGLLCFALALHASAVLAQQPTPTPAPPQGCAYLIAEPWGNGWEPRWLAMDPPRDYPNCSQGNDRRVVGNPTGGTSETSERNAMLQFDTSVLPDNAVIAAAWLRLHVTDVIDEDGLSLTGDYSAGFIYSNTCNFYLNGENALSLAASEVGALHPSGSCGTSCNLSQIVVGADNDFAVDHANANVDRQGLTTLRLAVTSAEATGANAVEFTDLWADPEPPAHLILLWCQPTPTPVPDTPTPTPTATPSPQAPIGCWYMSMGTASFDVFETRGYGTTYPSEFESCNSGDYTAVALEMTDGTNFATRQILLHWDIGTNLPAGAIVADAWLRLQVLNLVDTDGRSLAADWYQWGATCDAGDFTGAPADVALSSAGLCGGACDVATMTPGWREFRLENADANISRSGSTGLRLTISGGQPEGMSGIQIAAAGFANEEYPGGVSAPELALLVCQPTPTPKATPEVPANCEVATIPSASDAWVLFGSEDLPPGFASCSATIDVDYDLPMLGAVVFVWETEEGTQSAEASTLLRWDTSGLPASRVVTQASLRLYVPVLQDNGAHSLAADWYDWGATCDPDDFGAGSADALSSSGACGAACGLSNIVTGGYNDLPLDSASTHINREGATSMRLRLAGPETGGSNGLLTTNLSTYIPGPGLLVTLCDPTPTPTDTATPTDTPTPTPTDTPTPTHTFTRTFTATDTPTHTPIPEGHVAGEVFDDGTAQPLEGVHVAVVDDIVTATSDTHGRYTFPAIAGERLVELSKDGFTRSLRRLSIQPSIAQTILDGRLTALHSAVAIGDAGGDVDALHRVPGAPGSPATEGTVRLVVPPDTLPDGAALQLTPLTPQGLIYPVPLGWSVLIGVDIQGTGLTVVSGTATLRVPLSLLGAEQSLALVAAVWSPSTREWLGGATVSTSATHAEVSIDAARLAQTQIALLVADAEPAAPPIPAEGTAIQGVIDASLPESAVILAAPPAIVGGSSEHAFVLLGADGLSPLPSGTRLEAHLRESFDLRAGGRVAGNDTRQDVYTYQQSPKTEASSPPALGAFLNLVPSHDFDFAELVEGRVDIDVRLPPTDEEPGLIDSEGGHVDGPGGVFIDIPPDIFAGPTVIRVRPVPPSTLPDNAGSRPDFVGAIEVDAGDAAFDPHADYGFGVGSTVTDDARYLVARSGPTDEGAALIFVGFGRGENGRVVFDSCPPGLGGCLTGFGGSGKYAVFSIAADSSVVTGTVSDGAGPRSGLTVHSSRLAVVSVTSASGGYVLAAPNGVESVFAARDRVQDLAGSTAVTPPLGTEHVAADITLTVGAPTVVQIDPPNHGGEVPLGAVIRVGFSEPIAAASLNAAGAVTLVRVTKEANGSETESALPVRISLGGGGTELLLTPNPALESNSVYRLRLGAAITDRAGTPLVPFASDFTTAVVFSAESLPPDTLRVSLPDENGKSFVCAGPQVTIPGSVVTITNDATGFTLPVQATTAAGVSGSLVCDTLFPGRCNTSLPGTFCAVVDANVGERILVQVVDVRGDVVTLDAGNMRDEQTGATAIGPEGGVVFYPPDPRYSAQVPKGAFDEVTVVTIAPVAPEDFPAENPPDFEMIGAVHVDFGQTKAKIHLEVSVPAPIDATPEDQFITTRVFNLRGFDEQTMIDIAELENDTVITRDAPFPGVLASGTLGFFKATKCLGFVVGWAVITSHVPPGFIPGMPLLPFPLLNAGITLFAVPIVCDEPLTLSLTTPDGEVLDTYDAQGPPKGTFTEPTALLSDDHTPPELERPPFLDPTVRVEHDEPIVLQFSEPIRPSSIKVDTVELLDKTTNKVVAGKWVQSDDGKSLVFVPLADPAVAGLAYDHEYAVRAHGLEDLSGNVLSAPFEQTFRTFRPEFLSHVPIDAWQADILEREDGADPVRTIVVAEGDAYDFDYQGGLQAIDFTDPLHPVKTTRYSTAGVDRAVQVLHGASFSDSEGVLHEGTLIASLDGDGGRCSGVDPEHPNCPDRFGVLRLFNYPSDFSPIDARIINHSSLSHELFNSPESAEQPGVRHLFVGVPNNIGLPVSLALMQNGDSLDAAYIANTPVIGIEGLAMQGIDLTKNGVDGVLTDHHSFRAVATLKDHVLAMRQDGLVLTNAQLEGALAFLPISGSPLSVVAIPDWPLDLDADGNLGLYEDNDDDETTSEMEKVDLAVVPCDRRGICVIQVDLENGTLALIGKMDTPGGWATRGAAIDRERRLLYLADGGAGLTVVDFRDPRGTLDRNNDLKDDRVLYSFLLGTDGGFSVARDVVLDADPLGNEIAYVSAGAGGLWAVNVGMARASLQLRGVTLRFKNLPTKKPKTPAQSQIAAQIENEAADVKLFNEHITSLYAPEIAIPPYIAKTRPTIRVEVSVVDAEGNLVTPVGPSPVPASRIVTLDRVGSSNVYSFPRDDDGRFLQAVAATNLPSTDFDPLFGEAFPGRQAHPVYAGYGATRVRLRMSEPKLTGVRLYPIEKVGVVVLAIDGLRQDVFYAQGQDDVVDPNGAPRVGPFSLNGFGQVMGGRLVDGSIQGSLAAHTVRLRNAVAVFPSITLASWASVFSGSGPKDTKEFGNEFFNRGAAAANKPGVPIELDPPPGMVTYSAGSFPGYEEYETSQKSSWDFVPKEEENDGVDPDPTSQNRNWMVKSIFQRVQDEIPQYAKFFGRPVVQGQHYAKGALWLTTTSSNVIKNYIGGLIGPFVDAQTSVCDIGWRDRFTRYLRNHYRDWAERGVPFPGLVVFYQMGFDHTAHEAGLTAARTYLTDTMDPSTIQEIVAELKSVDQFYNKIFIITSDHGHTEIDPSPIGLPSGREEALDPPDPDNHNLHAQELDRLFQKMSTAGVPRFRVVLPVQENTSGTNFTQLMGGDVVAALNGPMVHVYVRDETIDGADITSIGSWANPPQEAVVDLIADGIIAGFGGEPAGFGTVENFNSWVRADTQLRNLDWSVDFLLVRKGGEYVVRRKPCDRTTPALPSCDDEALSQQSDSDYVKLQERIAMLNVEAVQGKAGSGDIIMVMRNKTGGMDSDRFTSASNIPSWHGSLNRSDSYVPFIVSYPGGNINAILPVIEDVCSSQTECDGNWSVSPLIHALLSRQLVQESQ